MSTGIQNIVETVVNSSLEIAKQAGMAIAADPEVQKSRIATCEACEFFIQGVRRCKQCGCPMDNKTWWESVGGVKTGCRPIGLCGCPINFSYFESLGCGRNLVKNGVTASMNPA